METLKSTPELLQAAKEKLTTHLQEDNTQIRLTAEPLSYYLFRIANKYYIGRGVAEGDKIKKFFRGEELTMVDKDGNPLYYIQRITQMDSPLTLLK